MAGYNLQYPHNPDHVRALAGHEPSLGHARRPPVHLSRYNLIMENLSPLAAQTYDFHPYHGTDGFAQLLVSGHLRVQPDVSQFGPHIRPMGCSAVRLPAFIGIQPPLSMALVFRSRKYGLFLLLSHDRGRHGFLLSLSQ